MVVEIDTPLPSERSVRILKQRCAWRGVLRTMHCEGGLELTSQALVNLCRDMGIAFPYIRSGRPNRNAHIERFNRAFRDEALDCYLSEGLNDVRGIMANWLITHKERWPHDALGDLPLTALREQQTAGNPTDELPV